MAAALLWALVAIGALLASVAVHFQLPITRQAAAEITNQLVTGLIGGELHIGYVEELSPFHAVARDVTLYDIDGRPVTWGDRAVVTFDLKAAMQGKLRFSSAHLHTGKVHLIEGDGLPTFVELFDDGTPSTPGPGLHAIVDDLRVHDVTLTGELLGLKGIRVEGLSAHGRMEFYDGMEIRIFSASGDMVEPFPFPARIEHIGGRITDDDHDGIRLHVRTHTDTERAHANVVYAVPEGAPADDDAELDLLIRADPIQAETLEQMGFEWAELLHGPARGHVRLYGPVDDLRLRASLETDGGPAQLEGHMPSVGDTVIDVRTEGVALERLVRDAPAVHVSGKARLIIPEDDDAEPRAHLQIDPLRYEGFQVPALDVEGTLLDDHFRIDRARGHARGTQLTGRGRVDYEGNVDLQVQARVTQMSREPNLARLLPGARGRMEADVRFATAEKASDRIDFRGRIVLHDMSYGTLTAKKLVIDGFAKGNPERPQANLTIDGHGLALADYPLGTARLEVRGGRVTTRAAASSTRPATAI
jgi:hypothetical protein